MNWEKALSALKYGKKLKRKDWGKIYICQKLSTTDLISWRNHPLIARLIKTNGYGKSLWLVNFWRFSYPANVDSVWIPDVEDLKADDWEIAYPKKTVCQVCGKIFNYGDEQSPVFTNELWNRILNFYHIVDNWIENPSQDSGYICYECVEKALGRKITNEDLQNVLFNIPFKEFYLEDYG